MAFINMEEYRSTVRRYELEDRRAVHFFVMSLTDVMLNVMLNVLSGFG